MRVKEEKKNKLKAIISHIICENPIVFKVIKEASTERYRIFTVQIKEDCDSWGSKDNCHIILGVGNLEKLFRICKSFNQVYHLQYSFDNRFFTLITNEDLNIETYDVKESFLENIVFLNGDTDDVAGTLAIHGLAFALYHELGHVKYDDDSLSQIEKERSADTFALKVLHEFCSQKRDLRLEDNPRFLGAFLENILILLVSKPRDAEIAASHPHPIERIYLFLDYFHVKEDSFLWKYAYDIIVKWANDNNIAMTFVKDCSISIKDKLLDFYHRYKK